MSLQAVGRESLWHDTVADLAASVRKYAGQNPGRGTGADDALQEIDALNAIGLFDLVSSTSYAAAKSTFPHVVAAGRELSGSAAAGAYWNVTAARVALAMAHAVPKTGEEGALESAEDGARCHLSLTSAGDTACTAVRDERSQAFAPAGRSWFVSGELGSVLGLDGARWILVSARIEGGWAGAAAGLFLVDLRAAGMKSRRSWSGEGLWDVSLRREPSLLVAAGDEETIRGVSESALSRVNVLQCADLLALARSCLTMTIAYLRERQQFGRALVSLPVVRAHIADAEIHLAVSEAVTGVALASICEESDGRGRADTGAALLARLSVQRRTEQSVLIANRLTGGVGYYDDYPLARLTRAFMVRARMFGCQAEIRALASRLLEETGAPFDTSRILRNPSHLLSGGNGGLTC